MTSKAKSLFEADVTPVPTAVVHPTPDDVRAIFAAARKVDDLEAMLRQMEADADTAVAEDRIERASEYAKRIKEKASRIRLLVAKRNADQAALEAMRLAETWMQLRVDATFAGTVRAERKRINNLPRKATDADIEAAHAKHPKQQAKAAEMVGLTDRQFRSRLAAIKKRKS